MVIYTYGREYPVTSVQETNDAYSVYICVDLKNAGFCRILSVKDRTLFPELVSWLSKTVDPSVFTDYLEHFIFEDTLCIVMKYTQGTSLANKLSTESMPLEERLELCRKILERIVLLDIPDYFLDKCADENNIMVSQDLTVNFNYPVSDIIGSRECAPMKRIDRLMRLMFAKELERKVPDELIAFFGGMPKLLDSDIIELYSAYYSMMLRIIERDAGEEEPKSIWYRIWNRIKKIWGTLKKILIVLLLAAAVTYLIFTINSSNSSGKKASNFDSIGTVIIDKNR